MNGALVDSFCQGSLPLLDSKEIRSLLQDFEDVQLDYVEKYMCTTTFCPCVKVNKSRWSLNQAKLARYSFHGTYSDFQTCYQTLLKKNVVPSLDPKLIGLIRSLESKADCSGLCAKPLFWFSKDISL